MSCLFPELTTGRGPCWNQNSTALSLRWQISKGASLITSIGYLFSKKESQMPLAAVLSPVTWGRWLPPKQSDFRSFGKVTTPPPTLKKLSLQFIWPGRPPKEGLEDPPSEGKVSSFQNKSGKADERKISQERGNPMT